MPDGGEASGAAWRTSSAPSPRGGVRTEAQASVSSSVQTLSQREGPGRGREVGWEAGGPAGQAGP